MGAAWVILAAEPVSKLPRDVWIYTGLLAVILFAGAIAIALTQRWRKRAANETYSAHDQLTSFRLLYERGELSQDEFERVRRQVLTRLKEGEAKLAAPAAAPASPPPADPNAPPPAPTPEKG